VDRKTISLNLPAHEIERLDALARELCMTRADAVAIAIGLLAIDSEKSPRPHLT
jgi:predicted DNA-binding protein